MRVNAQTKAATKQRILDAALQLFSEKGFDATTTRDITDAAQIASGTLFNYFPTKEAIIACLANQAVAPTFAQVHADAILAADSLEMELFALIAVGLRKLEPLRKYIPALFETSLNPLADAPGDDAAAFRTGHLEAVASLAARHGFGSLSPTALQLYWTLYTGILLFWAKDASPQQEETLALIDDSLNMLLAWLQTQQGARRRRKSSGA